MFLLCSWPSPLVQFLACLVEKEFFQVHNNIRSIQQDELNFPFCWWGLCLRPAIMTIIRLPFAIFLYWSTPFKWPFLCTHLHLWHMYRKNIFVNRNLYTIPYKKLLRCLKKDKIGGAVYDLESAYIWYIPFLFMISCRRANNFFFFGFEGGILVGKITNLSIEHFIRYTSVKVFQ